MIKFNEERIGRRHIYFKDDPLDAPNPGLPGFTIGDTLRAAGIPGYENYTPPYERPKDTGSTMTNITGVTDPNKFGGTTTSTTTNYTNLTPRATSVVSSTPSSAAEAMEGARAATAEKAAERATARNNDPRTKFAADNPRAGHAALDTAKGGVESMGSEVVNAINIANAAGTVANTALTAAHTSAYVAGRRIGESIIESALSALGVTASNKGGVDKITTDDINRAIESSMTPEELNALGADARRALVERTQNLVRAEAVMAEAIEDGIIVENAAKKGAETVKKALDEGKKAGGDVGGQHTNLGMLNSLLRAIESGKVDTEAAAKFQVGAQVTMAQMGYATTESLDVPKKTLSVNGFVSEFGDVVNSEESIAQAEEQVNSFIDGQIAAALVQLAAQLGMSQDEITRVKDAINKINDESASIEERESAYKDLVEDLLEKFNGASPWSKCEIYKILTGLFEKQVDKVTEDKDALRDAKEIFEIAKKDGTDVLVSDELATVQELDAKLKDDFEFAKEQENVCQRIKYNISLEDLEKYVTEESEAIYQVARERLNVGSVGLKKAGAVIKFLGAIVIAPFSPKFCVNTIKNSCRILANEGRAASQAIPEDERIDEYISNPEIRRACIELLEKENKLYADAGKMFDLENKSIKDLTKMFAFLLIGNIPFAFFYAIKLAVTLIKISSYSTEPEYIGENELNWDKLKTPEMWETDDGTVLPNLYILAYQELIKKAQAKYENLYGRDFIKGGNVNTENAEGYNYGVGSDEEIQEYIRSNVNRDRVARRMAQGI